MLDNHYDFVISGAGLVGCVITKQLDALGYDVCLVEKSKLDKRKEETRGFNTLSINHRSKLIFEKFGLWERILDISYPIEKLTLKYRSNLSKISFLSQDIGINELGYVCDRFKLLDILRDEVTKLSKGTILTNDKVSSVKQSDECLELELSSRKISTNSLLISDGIESELSEMVSKTKEHIDYGQKSFLLNCTGVFDQKHAIQIFNEFGIFALIPYSDNEMSLVITIKDEYVESFFTNSGPDVDMIKGIFQQYIEDIDNIKHISTYSLITHRNENFYKDRVMLLGNSLQLLHPVGAQGYNFSLRCIENIIDHLITHRKLNINIDSLIDEIASDRKKTMNNVDLAHNVLFKGRMISSLLSYTSFKLMRVNTSFKNKFLENILGLTNYPYKD